MEATQDNPQERLDSTPSPSPLTMYITRNSHFQGSLERAVSIVYIFCPCTMPLSFLSHCSTRFTLPNFYKALMLALFLPLLHSLPLFLSFLVIEKPTFLFLFLVSHPFFPSFPCLSYLLDFTFALNNSKLHSTFCTILPCSALYLLSIHQ